LNFKHTRCIPVGAVYVGRANRRYGLPGSKWANPFVEGKDGDRLTVIAKYKHEHLPSVIADIGELRGYDLVCWCAPQPCHADLLLALANA
jgi:hypothetical protein